MQLQQNLTNSKVSLVAGDLSGGVAIRAYLLAQALQKANYAVEIVGLLWGDRLYTQPPPGISVSTFPVKHSSGLFSSARKLFQAINGDIVYSLKPKPISFGLPFLKRLNNQRPLILDIDDWELSWHGGDQWRYRPGLKQFLRDTLKPGGALRQPNHPLYLRWMERLVPQANTVTVHNEFLQKRFGGIYVPNGKDTNLFNPQHYDPAESRERYGLSPYRVLMFPGAPRPYKGLEDVLAALDQLDQSDLRLVIVGGSPYDDYDNQLMQKWGRWIIKLPKIPYEKMPEVVAAAHIVVVPQRDEPATQAQFPLKLTDGMAMAKPILSTKVGDIPTILGNTGYLVEPSSPAQLADRIQWIFNNFKEAEAKGIQARKRCINDYSIDKMAKILTEVIASLEI